MSKIAVVILNWNGKKMLEKFLPSVIEHSSPVAEVIVADNGSTDDSMDFLHTSYPTLRTIQLDKNYGFAGGYNRALAQVDADYFILLNDDVEVTQHWIEPVIEQLGQDEKVAIAQPKLLMYDQRDTFEYAGGAGGFIDRYGYPFCRGRVFMTLEQDHGQYDDACEIFWASGAALFVKAAVWRELGGLDDDFFAHMEEIDFCWRAKNKGYQVVYCPKSTVYHVGGGTLPKSSPFKTQLNFRNNLAMLYKNLPQRHHRRVLMLRMVLDYIAGMKFLAEGHPKEFSAVVKAHKEFYSWHDDLRRKRKALNPKEVSCVYTGRLLFDYYLFKKNKFSKLNKNRITKQQ